MSEMGYLTLTLIKKWRNIKDGAIYWCWVFDVEEVWKFSNSVNFKTSSTIVCNWFKAINRVDIPD